MINNGGDLKKVNKNNQTPLHIASINNRGRIVEFLLGQGAKIEAQDDASLSPLLLAAQHGRSEALQVLIK